MSRLIALLLPPLLLTVAGCCDCDPGSPPAPEPCDASSSACAQDQDCFVGPLAGRENEPCTRVHCINNACQVSFTADGVACDLDNPSAGLCYNGVCSP